MWAVKSPRKWRKIRGKKEPTRIFVVRVQTIEIEIVSIWSNFNNDFNLRYFHRTTERKIRNQLHSYSTRNGGIISISRHITRSHLRNSRGREFPKEKKSTRNETFPISIWKELTVPQQWIIFAARDDRLPSSIHSSKPISRAISVFFSFLVFIRQRTIFFFSTFMEEFSLILQIWNSHWSENFGPVVISLLTHVSVEFQAWRMLLTLNNKNFDFDCELVKWEKTGMLDKSHKIFTIDNELWT